MRISRRQIMVRPTLIVGLGGTGVMICQWLESYIHKILNRVPPFIRFLKLDTDALEEGGPPDAGASDFINLFHHMDVGEVVRDCAAHPEFHPHLDWLKGLRLDACFADYGCQGIPRLGRLVFAELGGTVIHKAVAARFGDLRACTQKAMEGELGQFILAPDGAPAVHIASSVCGGTGAGMLIDMAYNLRWWSKESFPRAAEIIGHLMLPEAFTVDPLLHSKLQAVAGATLEQIEFLSDPRRDDIPVRYRELSGEHFFGKLTAPFNFVYLLNGHGDVGIGNRKHLVKMMARAIRAMTIEPTSQQVASDANNKLADILGLLDPANGHRQCFASYGLWYGTPAHDDSDVESWICSGLEEMAAGHSPNHTDYRQQVKRELRSHLDISAEAAQIGWADHDFNWQIGPTDQRAGRGWSLRILKQLQAYLSETVEPAIRSEANAIIPPEQPSKALLDVADRMVEQDVFDAKSLEPLGQVGVCLNQWIEQLDGWLGKTWSNSVLAPKAAIEKIKTNAKQELKNEASRQSTPQLQPAQVNSCINKVIEENWDGLVAAILHENIRKSVERTLEVFRLRRQALDSVVSLASTGQLRNILKSSSAGAEKKGPERTEDFFSVRLSASSDLTKTEEDSNKAEEDSNKALAQDFREKFIKPILSNLVLSIGQTERKVGISDVERDFKEKVIDLDLKEAIRQFADKANEHSRNNFHDGVASDTEPKRHTYYEPVTKIYELSAPKIGLNRAGVYARPLDVTISQHVRGGCAPILLSHNLGSTFLEAHINKKYEGNTKIWLQVLRLCYGFCLESISTYARYVEAVEDYVTRRRFEYCNIWLNDDWYAAYQAAKARWKDERDESQKGDKAKRAKYNKIAQFLGNFRKATEVIFVGLYGKIPSLPKVETAVKVMALCKEAEYEVKRVLDGLRPADEPASIKKGLERYVELMKPLSAETGEVLEPFPKQEQTKMRERWDKCQRCIKNIGDFIEE